MARRGVRGIPRERAWTVSEDRAVMERLNAEHPDWRALARDLARTIQAVATRAGKLRKQQRALRSPGARPCSNCGALFGRPNRQGRQMLCSRCYGSAGESTLEPS